MGSTVTPFMPCGAIFDPSNPTAEIDMTSLQYHIMKKGTAANEITTAGAGQGIGILADAPAIDTVASLCVLGPNRVKLAAALVKGAAFKSDASGQAVAATTSGDAPIGVIMQGGASGEVVECMVRPNSGEVNKYGHTE